MWHKKGERIQFCPKGHDTFVTGRYIDKACCVCRSNYYKNKIIEIRKYIPRKWSTQWMNIYQNNILILQNRKTGIEYKILIDNDSIPYLKYFQWSPRFSDKKKTDIRIISGGSIGYKLKQTILIYHLIMGPVPKRMTVDHLNGNTLDNRKINLEIVTNQENLKRAWKRRK